MLSKCLNPDCSASFRYLGKGRLFRVDFSELGRKSSSTGRKHVVSIRSKAHPVENFWLCERCAAKMTVQLSEEGEVRLISIGPAPRPVTVPQGSKSRGVSA
jgi:hypothetical protein